jgi:hypothetical protein
MSWRRDLEERLGEQEDATDLFWRKHQAESGTADASPGDWRARAFPDVSLTDDQLADLRAGLEPRPISNSSP